MRVSVLQCFVVLVTSVNFAFFERCTVDVGGREGNLRFPVVSKELMEMGGMVARG